eukprot:TRINITY_DN1668_c0_g1_i1.p1 TRINITY_DN1668_c0_g1~~TRINITY_DN1668_c0_g1_i1.p1  ORF type:complete len:169 (-),score=29.33 TRINITY_DN1668_c0_g1_i1:33-539(-)
MKGVIKIPTKKRKRPDGKAPKYNPFKDPNIEGDAHKTLFVARISFRTSEESLRQAFQKFGEIESIRLVHDTVSGKSRGYGFIRYKHKTDFYVAYKQGHKMLLDGCTLLVDKERGRLELNWKPKRLGGGLGNVKKHSKRKRGSFLRDRVVPSQDNLNKEREFYRNKKQL